MTLGFPMRLNIDSFHNSNPNLKKDMLQDLLDHQEEILKKGETELKQVPARTSLKNFRNSQYYAEIRVGRSAYFLLKKINTIYCTKRILYNMSEISSSYNIYI